MTEHFAYLRRASGDEDAAKIGAAIRKMTRGVPSVQSDVRDGFAYGKEATCRVVERLGRAHPDPQFKAWADYLAVALRRDVRFSDFQDGRDGVRS